MSFKRSIAMIVAAVSLASAGAKATVFIDQNFDSTDDTQFAFGAGNGIGGNLDRWEGNGTISVTSAKFAGASGKSVVITDSNASPGAASALFGSLPTINSGYIQASFDFASPDLNDFALYSFGGGHTWFSSAAQLVSLNGVLTLKYGDGSGTIASVDVGTYSAGEWVSGKFVFDVANKKYDFFLNGTQVASRLSFEDSYTSFSTDGNIAFEIDSDLNSVDRAGAPVLYIDNVNIASVPTPEPASLALTSIGAAAVLRRRRI